MTEVIDRKDRELMAGINKRRELDLKLAESKALSNVSPSQQDMFNLESTLRKILIDIEI